MPPSPKLIRLAAGQKWIFPDGQWLEIVRMMSLPGRKNPVPYCRNKAGNEWIGGLHTTARILEAEGAVLKTPQSPDPVLHDPWRGWSVTRNRDIQTFHPIGNEPDPAWRYTDKAGHEHYRYEHGPEPYPTLAWVVDQTYYCPDCRDDHEEGHYECPVCCEHVAPGTRSAQPYSVPGLWHGEVTAPNGDRYVLTGEEIEAYKHGPAHLFGLVSKRQPDQWTRSSVL